MHIFSYCQEHHIPERVNSSQLGGERGQSEAGNLLDPKCPMLPGC